MQPEERTILNYHYLKSLFQVLIECDLRLALVQARSLRAQLEDPSDLMPEHLRHDLLEYCDVRPAAG